MPMSNKEFKDLIEKVLTAEPVYINGTGIRCIVTKYYKEKRKGRRYGRQDLTKITFIDPPNKKAIDKCTSYDVEVEERINNQTQQKQYVVHIDANIDIQDLRAVPYKTTAAQVLFGNPKETKNEKV